MDDIYVYNTLNKDTKVQVFGNHFTFKPLQVKRFRAEIGDFMGKEKGYLGLVVVSEKFDDPSYKETDEGKAELEAKRREGVEKRIRHLEAQVHNLQVSLRMDLDTANIKADVLSFATDGDLQAMEELRDLQKAKLDPSKERLEKARKLSTQLKANSSAIANQKD